jgi:hypothetical protein
MFVENNKLFVKNQDCFLKMSESDQEHIKMMQLCTYMAPKMMQLMTTMIVLRSFQLNVVQTCNNGPKDDAADVCYDINDRVNILSSKVYQTCNNGPKDDAADVCYDINDRVNILSSKVYQTCDNSTEDDAADGEYDDNEGVAVQAPKVLATLLPYNQSTESLF